LRLWAFISRLALAVLGLALLYYFGLLRFDALTSLYGHPGRVAVCSLLLFSTIPLGAVRWHFLLWCQGFRLPFRKTLAVVFIGQFFNTFLPGAYGGDLIRAGYVYHGARQQAGRLLLSLLADRLSGLIGLICLAIATHFALPAVVNFRMTAWMVAVGITAVGVALLLPVLGQIAAPILNRFSPRLGGRLLSLSAQVGAANRIYLARPQVVIGAVAISVVQFALALGAYVVLASAFDFVTAAPATIAYASVVSLIANSIPLTPGGIGVGEAVFANTIPLVDPGATGPYATIFLAVRALSALLSLPGGLVFLGYRSEVIEYTSEVPDAPERS